MSHPFGDLLSQHLHRKHGVSQAKLAAGTGQPPSVISLMSRGQRLTGGRARARVLTIIGWLQAHDLLTTIGEAQDLLSAAGLVGLDDGRPEDAALLHVLLPDPPLPVTSRMVRPRLPVDLSRFIGRTQELRCIRRLLRTTRLLTLTGTGGVGKTRLALALTRELIADGYPSAAYVELGVLTDPTLVPQAVAAALGAREQSGHPLMLTLLEVLSGRELLLVLDNCEHLLHPCAILAHELLQSCPGLTILATSRESLAIKGETVWSVPPLSLPESQLPLEQIVTAEAVQLVIAKGTAERHVSNILGKLDMTTRSQIAVWAVTQGHVRPDSSG